MNEKGKRKFEILSPFSNKKVSVQMYILEHIMKGAMQMKDLETRVWQRVQGEKEGAKASSGCGNLQGLIAEQLQLSAVYVYLSRQQYGKDGTTYMRLAREAKMQATCLKGIMALTAGQIPAIGVSPAQISSQDANLRRCYGQELRLYTEYENRRNDPEYGPVFERLASRGQDHCCALLELIGSCSKK